MSKLYFICLVPRPRHSPRSIRFGSRDPSDTSPRRVVKSQQIERECLSKSRTGTRQYKYYCISDTVVNAVASLNKALPELNNWCFKNSLTPHSATCEAMLLESKPYIGLLNSAVIGDGLIEWVNHTRLLGLTIDDRLSWTNHLISVKKSFVNKMNMLKRSSFSDKKALLDLYFKVILPSVLYGLVIWGGCNSTDHLNSLELLHRRAARVIYNLPQDMPSADVYRHCNWNTIDHQYKLGLI